jgi:hypothetical protein
VEEKVLDLDPPELAHLELDLLELAHVNLNVSLCKVFVLVNVSIETKVHLLFADLAPYLKGSRRLTRPRNAALNVLRASTASLEMNWKNTSYQWVFWPDPKSRK